MTGRRRLCGSQRMGATVRPVTRSRSAPPAEPSGKALATWHRPPRLVNPLPDPRPARDEMVGRFEDPRGPQLLLVSLKAGGTGLNLTAASHVIHLDRWWNPAVEDQA